MHASHIRIYTTAHEHKRTFHNQHKRARVSGIMEKMAASLATTPRLLQDARQIFEAALESVFPERLMADALQVVYAIAALPSSAYGLVSVKQCHPYHLAAHTTLFTYSFPCNSIATLPSSAYCPVSVETASPASFLWHTHTPYLSHPFRRSHAILSLVPHRMYVMVPFFMHS